MDDLHITIEPEHIVTPTLILRSWRRPTTAGFSGRDLLPFSPRDPQLVMGWHLRPEARGHGVAGQMDYSHDPDGLDDW